MATGEEGAGKGLFCRACKEGGRCSSLLFEHDWQGVLWCVCFNCWKLEQDDDQSWNVFERLRKASWRTRISSTKSVQRGIELQKALAETERMENESKRAFCRRVIHNTAAAVAIFVTGFMRLTEEKKALVINALDNWFSEGERIIKDGDYTPALRQVVALEYPATACAHSFAWSPGRLSQ
jgi:hypothetical protein